MNHTALIALLNCTDYLTTVNIAGGGGEKEWYLAPPEATGTLWGTARFTDGHAASNTSGYTPWIEPPEIGNERNCLTSDLLTDADRKKEIAAHACFRSVTVGGGDLLIVPSNWWHAVVTRGRCVAVNWWWNPPPDDEGTLETAHGAEEKETALPDEVSTQRQNCKSDGDALVLYLVAKVSQKVVAP